MPEIQFLTFFCRGGRGIHTNQTMPQLIHAFNILSALLRCMEMRFEMESECCHKMATRLLEWISGQKTVYYMA